MARYDAHDIKGTVKSKASFLAFQKKKKKKKKKQKNFFVSLRTRLSLWTEHHTAPTRFSLTHSHGFICNIPNIHLGFETLEMVSFGNIYSQ